MPRKILVTDFDGTVTRNDFYRLAIERLVPAGTPDYWGQYRAGTLTHFDALNAVFKASVGGETALLEVARAMEPDPELAAGVAELKQAGWQVVVASAGCRWYIDRLLAEAGVSLEVFANPGSLEGEHLVMRRVPGSPVDSNETGIDKAAVVKLAAQKAEVIAFAGDGFPDLPASLLVPPSLRFATGALATELTRLGEAFHPFRRWKEIADGLIRSEKNN